MIRYPDGRVEGSPEELARYVRALGLATPPNWPVFPFQPALPHPRWVPSHHYPTYTFGQEGARVVGVSEGIPVGHATINDAGKTVI